MPIFDVELHGPQALIYRNAGFRFDEMLMSPRRS